MSSDIRAGSHRSAIDDLGTLRIFVAVVEAGSFTEAGRRMRVVPSTVSKHISSLEARLQGQLITRSTQQLSVTELGRRFYERCLNILHTVQIAESEVREYQGEAQGLLRISAAPVLASGPLIPMLERFLKAHPKVQLELNVTTTTEDLIASGLDAAIRISSNLDPNLIAVKLAENERVYCATPRYLEQHGRPASIEDLDRHNCLVIKNVAQSAYWPMRMPDGSTKTVHVAGNFTSSSADTVLVALLRDMGVGHIARFLVQQSLDAGDLIELFPDDRVVVAGIYIVFPKRRDLPLKARAFIDHLRSEFHGKWPWAV